MRANVLEYRDICRCKLKNNSQIVFDGKAPMFAQLAGKLVRLKSLLTRIGFEDFHAPPKFSSKSFWPLIRFLKARLKDELKKI